MRRGLGLLVLAMASPLLAAVQQPLQGDANTLPPETPSVAAPLSLDEYRTALGTIGAALERGEWEAARSWAEGLSGARIEAEGGPFEADPTLLEGVLAARDAAGATSARLRIARVLATLGGGSDDEVLKDAALLERLAREEAARRPTPGGSLDPSFDAPAPNVPEQLRAWLARATDAVAELLQRLWRWILRFGPRKAREGGAGTTATAVAIMVGVIAVLLAVLAIRSLRRPETGAAPAGLEESAPGRDEDPLSRQAGEWQKYAGELAAAGRWREAIRAWYHAVLVTLFRAGQLHHQKGRTNWEYVSQVGPEAPLAPRVHRSHARLRPRVVRPQHERGAGPPRVRGTGTRGSTRAGRGGSAVKRLVLLLAVAAFATSGLVWLANEPGSEVPRDPGSSFDSSPSGTSLAFGTCSAARRARPSAG